MRLAALAFVFLVLALSYTYPLVLDPSRANRFDSPDALLCAWTLSWDLRQLARAPWDLFDANIFHPDRGALAYSENLVAAALLVAPLRLVTSNPVLLLNAALVAALVASGLATYLLARELDVPPLGGLLAGILFAFGPFRWAHVPHLQLQLAFPIPLALYFVSRCCRTPNLRAALGLGASVALAFASSGYYAVYLLTVLPIFAVSGLVTLSPELRRPAVLTLLAAAAVGVALSLPLVLPYVEKLNEGSRRTLAEAAEFSAGPLDYLSSFSRLHFFLPKNPEPLFPGFVALGLTVAAFVRDRKREVWLLAAVGALGATLSFGPSAGLFSLLYRFVPAYQGLRVPSRAGILVLLAVSLLAARGVTRLSSRRLRAGLTILVAAECYAGPLPWSFDSARVPAIYASVAERKEPGALMELPLPPPDQFQLNAIYVYRSLAHFRPLVNGYSGFVPESYRDVHRRLSTDFEGALTHLERIGVGLVLVHEGRLGPRLKREVEEAHALGRLRLVRKVDSDRLYVLGN